NIMRWGRDIFDVFIQKINLQQPQDLTVILSTNHHAADIVCDQEDCGTVHDAVHAVEHVLHDVECAECDDTIIINIIMRFYHMVHLYEKIANLPIGELLNLLDEVTDHYENLSTNYEFSNQKMTWSSWLRKYWWVPPITAVSAIVLYVKNSKVINNIFNKITT